MTPTLVLSVLGIIGGIVTLVHTGFGAAEAYLRLGTRFREERNYKRWLRETLRALARLGKLGPDFHDARAEVAEFERAWAERAIADGELEHVIDEKSGQLLVRRWDYKRNQRRHRRHRTYACSLT